MRPQRGATAFGSLLLVLVGVAAMVFVVRASQQDAAFCRRALRGLVEGRLSAQRHLDWPQLTALGMDVGAAYRQLPDDQERRQYQAAFVEHFSKAFQQAQGRFEAFTRWRVLERRGRATLVAADYAAANRALVMTVTSAGWGRKRIGAIQWQ